MRKTCPILIPDQQAINHRSQIPSPNHQYQNDGASDFTIDSSDIDSVDNNVNYRFDDDDDDDQMATTSHGYLLTDNNEMPSTSAHPSTDNNRIDQLPELNSLNNEFLNTILTTQSYQPQTVALPSQSEHLNDSNYVGNIDDDVIRTTQYDDTRPRQLGRRSEMRSRIVSITAERSAEGNQVRKHTHKQ